MPSVTRKSYSRPVPPDAVPAMVTVKRRGRSVQVPGVRFTDSSGKTVTAPLTAKGDRYRLQTTTYYGRVAGRLVPLCENRAASEIMLGDLRRKKMQQRAGLVSPYEEYESRPLADLLESYRVELETRGRTARFIQETINLVSTMFTRCRFRTIADIDADKVNAFLAELRRPLKLPEIPDGIDLFMLPEVAALLGGIKSKLIAGYVHRHHLTAIGQGRARRFPRSTVQALQALVGAGASIETVNGYLRKAKSFCNWLVQSRKMAVNPLAHLRAANGKADPRHSRGEFTLEEISRLLATTRNSTRTLYGLDGESRSCLYLLALSTGIRAGGLASLTPESFTLEGDLPTVTLTVKNDKSRRGKLQPVPRDVAEAFRVFLQGKPAGQPIWPGRWAADRLGSRMLRVDLQAAGIPYRIVTADGVAYRDLHAARHTYLTMGGRSGIDLATLQAMAGHTSPTITVRYLHNAKAADLAVALKKMPSIAPTLRATGTDGPGSSPISACSNLAQPPDGIRGELIPSESIPLPNASEVDAMQPHNSMGVEHSRGELMGIDASTSNEGRNLVSLLGWVEKDLSKSISDKQVTSDTSSLLAQILPSLPDDLLELVQAWGGLPLYARSAITTIVRSSIPSDPR